MAIFSLKIFSSASSALIKREREALLADVALLVFAWSDELPPFICC
jgi:hypothetical protein